MSATQQAASNKITLKGSTGIVSEFFCKLNYNYLRSSVVIVSAPLSIWNYENEGNIKWNLI